MSHQFESTSRLLDRARGGDQTALEQLFARHLTAAALGKWTIAAMGRDVADTDDLVQDTLIQSFKRLDAFEARRVGALQACLCQAVLNRIRDEIRRKGRQPENTELDDVLVDTSNLSESLNVLRSGTRTTAGVRCVLPRGPGE